MGFFHPCGCLRLNPDPSPPCGGRSGWDVCTARGRCEHRGSRERREGALTGECVPVQGGNAHRGLHVCPGVCAYMHRGCALGVGCVLRGGANGGGVHRAGGVCISGRGMGARRGCAPGRAVHRPRGACASCGLCTKEACTEEGPCTERGAFTHPCVRVHLPGRVKRPCVHTRRAMHGGSVHPPGCQRACPGRAAAQGRCPGGRRHHRQRWGGRGGAPPPGAAGRAARSGLAC